MNRKQIICLVEGQGEDKAVPILIRRVAQEINPALQFHLSVSAFRVKRDKVVKAGELENAIRVAAQTFANPGAILILLDADEDCPAALAPQLLQRAQAARSDLPIAVVLAQREYEAWLIAAAESLRGKRGLSDTLQTPAAPEAIRDAKGWLSKHAKKGSPYKPTVDQAALTAVFNLQAARKAAFFAKLYKEIARLLAELELLPADTVNFPASPHPPTATE